MGLRCRGNSQRDGKDKVKQHLDSTAALGCYGICVYCTAAGDHDREATGAVDTVRRPRTKVAFVGPKLGEKTGSFANFIDTVVKPHGNKSKEK